MLSADNCVYERSFTPDNDAFFSGTQKCYHRGKELSRRQSPQRIRKGMETTQTLYVPTFTFFCAPYPPPHAAQKKEVVRQKRDGGVMCDQERHARKDPPSE